MWNGLLLNACRSSPAKSRSRLGQLMTDAQRFKGRDCIIELLALFKRHHLSHQEFTQCNIGRTCSRCADQLLECADTQLPSTRRSTDLSKNHANCLQERFLNLLVYGVGSSDTHMCCAERTALSGTALFKNAYLGNHTDRPRRPDLPDSAVTNQARLRRFKRPQDLPRQCSSCGAVAEDIGVVLRIQVVY